MQLALLLKKIILQNLVNQWLEKFPNISLCNVKWAFCCVSDFKNFLKLFTNSEAHCIFSLTTVIISSQLVLCVMKPIAS